MKNPKSAMISCNDGFRPESFLLEVMDEEAGAVVSKDVPAKKMPTWEKRRILAHGPKMMMVENEFAPGDTAPEHKHPHIQITYVIDGALEFVVEGEKKVLRNGDSVYIAPDEIHSATALERTLIIDMFAPMREDFLE